MPIPSEEVLFYSSLLIQKATKCNSFQEANLGRDKFKDGSISQIPHPENELNASHPLKPLTTGNFYLHL